MHRFISKVVGLFVAILAAQIFTTVSLFFFSYFFILLAVGCSTTAETVPAFILWVLIWFVAVKTCIWGLTPLAKREITRGEVMEVVKRNYIFPKTRLLK